MRRLLDTQALIWWVSDAPRLSRVAAAAIATGEDVAVSAASAYEITLKHALGKLPGIESLARDLAGAVLAEGFLPLPMTLAHAELAGRLPLRHRDPFDRLLAAQALLEGRTMVSSDAAFDQFGVARLWQPDLASVQRSGDACADADAHRRRAVPPPGTSHPASASSTGWCPSPSASATAW